MNKQNKQKINKKIIQYSFLVACDGAADVAFLLDKSGSIRNDQWPRVQDFVNFVINNLEVGPNKVQVAAASFDDSAALEFRLNQYR